jgi:hypothetical protein
MLFFSYKGQTGASEPTIDEPEAQVDADSRFSTIQIPSTFWVPSLFGTLNPE